MLYEVITLEMMGVTLTMMKLDDDDRVVDDDSDREHRITSYNVCYTKLLRSK